MTMLALNGCDDERSRIPQFSMMFLVLAIGLLPLCAQSNRSMLLLAGGTWHLHAHLPLGNDALLLEPAHHPVEMLASVECPQFEGWSLGSQDEKPVLLDAAGKPVRVLPSSMTFRVSVISGAKPDYENPMPLEYSKSPDQLLLDVHFKVQIFRGMAMREIQPSKEWMIGVPADEPALERIYRAQFDWGEVRPDDRIVLLVTDGAGRRLTKFHLEFL